MNANEIANIFSWWHQSQAIENLSSALARALVRKQWKPLSLLGGAGLGKTTIMRAVIEFLTNHGYRHIVCDARDPNSMREFMAYTFGKPNNELKLITLDESHNVKPGTLGELKEFWTGTDRIITDVPVRIETEDGEETVYPTYNPSNVVWLLGTNTESTDQALVRRMQETALTAYGPKGMRAILTRHLLSREIPLESRAVMDMLVRNCRPNGGASETLCDALADKLPHYNGVTVRCEAGMRNLLGRAGYVPGGWNSYHVNVLEYAAGLSNRGGTLTDIGSAPLDGRGQKSAARHVTELVSAGYMVTQGGKAITQAGRDFLTSAKQWQAKHGFDFTNK